MKTIIIGETWVPVPQFEAPRVAHNIKHLVLHWHYVHQYNCTVLTVNCTVVLLDEMPVNKLNVNKDIKHAIQRESDLRYLTKL